LNVLDIVRISSDEEKIYVTKSKEDVIFHFKEEISNQIASALSE